MQRKRCFLKPIDEVGLRPMSKYPGRDPEFFRDERRDKLVKGELPLAKPLQSRRRQNSFRKGRLKNDFFYRLVRKLRRYFHDLQIQNLRKNIEETFTLRV